MLVAKLSLKTFKMKLPSSEKMSKKKERVLRIKATFGSLEKISDFIQERAQSSNLGFKKTWELMLVIDEICFNIISHSCSDGTSQNDLWIDWDDKPDCITVSFLDNGALFNPLEGCAEDAEIQEENVRLGGMGTYLIEKMVEEVSYSCVGGKNHVVLKKHIHRHNHAKSSGCKSK